MTNEKKGLAYYKEGADNLVKEMLKQSNWIEQEMSKEALEDAIKAWNYAIKNSQEATTKYILKIHDLLCGRINKRIAGKYRDCDVYIGGDKKFFVSQALLEQEVRDWLNEVNVFKKPKVGNLGEMSALAKKAHVRFEGIHPFEDGNGRVGRILYNVHRVRLGLHIHTINIGEEQIEYYQWFKGEK